MKHLLQFRHNLLKVHSRSGYIVLLPEVPPTNESLSKLNLSNHEKLPQFTQLTTERCVTLMGQRIIEYETQLLSIEDRISEEQHLLNQNEEKNNKSHGQQLFSKVFDAFEGLNTQFDNTWSLLKHLYLTSKPAMPPNIYLGIHNRAIQARHKRYNLKNIYNACKTIDTTDLSEEQQRVLHRYLLESKLSGLELSEENRSKLNDCNTLCYHKQRLFQLKLDAALKAYQLPINNLNVLPEAPEDLIYNMAVDKRDITQGPWMATLIEPVKTKFMEYCKDRERRYQMWNAEETVASLQEDRKELNTSIVLQEIRRMRRTKAQLLGYDSHLDLSLETKMVGNIETLENILEEVRIKARLAQDEEVESMQTFINKEHPIQIWDVPYYGRLQKKQLYNYDETEWTNYFSFDNVLQTLFNLCTQLFDIQFVEKSNIDKWNEHIRYFDIFEKNCKKPIGGFYIDPYKNSNKFPINQVIGIRSNSTINQRICPLSTLVLNLNEPKYGKPCLLNFQQVEELFYHFGSILQRSLTLTNYSDVSGVTNMEWDSVHIVNHFLTHWIYNENVFNQLNSHYITGEKLNNINLNKLRSHNYGIDLCMELFKINLDLQMSSSEKFWADISRELYPLHFGFPIEKYSNLPCRFDQISSGDYGGSYFSFLYSKIVSVDIYYAFQEEEKQEQLREDSQNKKNKFYEGEVGNRLRDTFLTFGGSCHSSEIFRRFRGRDPCYKPFLHLFNLNSKE